MLPEPFGAADDAALAERWTQFAMILTIVGRIPLKDVSAAFHPSAPDRKEAGAEFLTTELHRLRGLQQAKQAPGHTKHALSPIMIADMAVTMLESCDGPPGPKLTSLISQLLWVDRHRATRAEKWNGPFFRAADIEAQGKLAGKPFSVRALARMAGVDATQVSRWRKSDDYVRACNFALAQRARRASEERNVHRLKPKGAV